MIYKGLELAIKDIDFATRIVKGYFSAFGNKDSDGDIIVKGSYSKTIQEQGPKSSKPRIKHLLDHDITKVVGVIQELKEDNYGLYYESKIGTHTLGEDVLKMYDEGIITEHSVMIGTVKAMYDKSADANIISEVKMWEGSALQAWGSNANTPVVKSLQEMNVDDLFERYKKFIKVARKGTMTDETLELLEIEAVRIEARIKELLKSGEPAKVTSIKFEPEELQKYFGSILN